MSKAEDRALEKYPVEEHIFYGPYPGASEPSKFDDNKPYRIGFIEGYEKAEKDLELTWEDIERIDDISIRLDGTEEAKKMSNKEFYQEVLKRFNKKRKEL